MFNFQLIMHQYENRDAAARRRDSATSTSAGSIYSKDIPIIGFAPGTAGTEKNASGRAPGTTAAFGVPVHMWYTNEPEDDDALHAPDVVPASKRSGGLAKTRVPQPFVLWSSRGWLNATTLGVLITGLLALFIGYPIYIHVRNKPFTGPGFNIGNINASGQVPDLPNMKLLVDSATPESAKSRQGTDGQTYTLVFSDEFEVDGRSFYPGDDPYWEAHDLHYW